MLGINVKYHREKTGLSQKALGEKLGVHQSMIAQIERGSKPVSHPLLLAMSELFEVSMDSLVKDDRNSA